MDEQEALRRLRERDQELSRARAELANTNVPFDLRKLAFPVPDETELSEQRRRAEQREQYERDWKERRLREEREAREERNRIQAPLRERLTTYEAAQTLKLCPPAVAQFIASDAWRPDATAVKSARTWAKRDVRGLVLRGGVGVGKTVAAACALAEFAQVSPWGGEGKFSWHRPNDFVSGMLHKYAKDAPKVGTGMVVVDDVGRETKSDFEEAMVQLIDDSLTRFVITTNLTVDELHERYEERLMDRLKQSCIYVSVAGASQRRAAS